MTKSQNVTPLRSVKQPPGGDYASLAAAVRDACAGMKQWSTAADVAAQQLAIRMAQQIDDTEKRARLAEVAGDVDEKLARWCDVAETLDRLGPKLHAILRDLGSTVAGRKDIKVQERPAGRLARLRQGGAQ